MSDLLAARGQMAMSLAFHILFAVAGMAMPLLMVLAEWLYQRTGEPATLELAKRWAKGTAILFAVGAVSGTVLSFELGLLWPQFMRHAGPLVGMPFSLEGFAFFLEAIFLGLYLYGWTKLPPKLHLACGVGVALCGLSSAVFVTAVNAWMNEPAGFSYDAATGTFSDIRPYEAMFNNAFFSQALHMALAAYVAVSIAVMAVHAWVLRRDGPSPLHEAAFRITFMVALVATPAQMLSGHHSAQHIATAQPVKLAAAEGLYETQSRAPLALGGVYDEEHDELRGAVELPALLSVMAFNDPDAEVQGLDQTPRELWPPVTIVHLSFDLMVACGMGMLALVSLGVLLWIQSARRGGPPPWRQRRYLRLAIAAGPLGMIAIEAGWVVTEVGRQPWIIRGYMKTAEAVTPMPHLLTPFIAFSLLYLFLGVVVIALLKNHVFAARTLPAPGFDAPEDAA